MSDYSLSDPEKRALLGFARLSIESALKDRPAPSAEDFAIPLTDPLRQARSCFVTLLNKDRSLRGCIGTLESQSALFENAAHYARSAAFEDPRFESLTAGELQNLIIEMSVLGPLRPLPDIGQLTIGRHGLYVTSGHHRGVLLAKVAEEQEWTRNRFLKETCHKACLDPKRVDQFEVSYFEEISFSEND